MLEPGTTVDADGSAGGDWRLSVRVQSIKATQPVGLSEPRAVRGATLSIPGSGRAPPSLCQGWTKPERKHNLNQELRLTHGVVQKSEPGHIRRLDEAARARLLASEDARNGVMLTLLSDVASDYFQ